MAITYHPDVQVVSGTDWTLAGILYDATGKVLDVTNCILTWGLLDPDGLPVLPLNADVQIAKTDPINGAIQISVTEADTALLPGRYTDALQVTEGTSTDVFWIGSILVAANPFNVINGVIEQPVPPPVVPVPFVDNITVAPIPPWWIWQQEQQWAQSVWWPWQGWYY